MKEKKALRFGLIIFGLFFMFNPDAAGIDVLPDLLGCFLISYGISGASLMNSQLAEAQKGFGKLILISALRLIAVMSVFRAAKTERDSLLLLIAFAFAVLDLIVAYPAWKNLYKGLFYLDRMNINTGKRSVSWSGASKLTSAFLFCKSLFAVLPELSLMSVTEESQGLYEYVDLFRFFSVSLMLVFGIIWLVIILKFFISLSRNSAYNDTVNDRFFSEILPQNHLFIKQNINSGFLLLSIGFVIGIDAHMDYKNILPDIFAAAFIIAGVLILKKYTGKIKWLIFSASAWGIISTALEVSMQIFVGKYGDPSAVYRDAGAYDLYPLIITLGIIDAIFSAVTVLLSVIAIKRIISGHTGYSMVIDGSAHSDKRTAEIRSGLNGRLVPVMALAFVCCALEIIYYITQPFALKTFFEAIPVIRFFADAFLAFFICFALYNVRREVAYKYEKYNLK